MANVCFVLSTPCSHVIRFAFLLNRPVDNDAETALGTDERFYCAESGEHVERIAMRTAGFAARCQLNHNGGGLLGGNGAHEFTAFIARDLSLSLPDQNIKAPAIVRHPSQLHAEWGELVVRFHVRIISFGSYRAAQILCGESLPSPRCCSKPSATYLLNGTDGNKVPLQPCAGRSIILHGRHLHRLLVRLSQRAGRTIRIALGNHHILHC